MHGGVKKENLAVPDKGAVLRGLANLEKHIENVRKFGVPPVVSINIFTQDSKEEFQAIYDHCQRLGVPVKTSNVWPQGGDGGIELAKRKVEINDRGEANFHCLYNIDEMLQNKVRIVAKEIYGAKDVSFGKEALLAIESYEKMGLGGLPVCMAKTQYSFSDNPALLGRPEGFTIHVRTARLSAGAGFVVMLTGDIMTMPGLPKVPAAERIDVDENGVIKGLF